MAEDIRDIHLQWMRQMLGCVELPKEVLDLYCEVKLANDRVSGGELNPQVLALIAVWGARKAGMDLMDPPEVDDGEDDDERGDTEINWSLVPEGAPVIADWQGGRKRGTFQGVAPRNKLRVKLETGAMKLIRARRVEVVTEPVTGG
jgi:hypothetical protein